MGDSDLNEVGLSLILVVVAKLIEAMVCSKDLTLGGLIMKI